MELISTAVFYKDLPAIRRILKADPSLSNYSDEEKSSLLHCAIIYNREDIIHLVCEKLPYLLLQRRSWDLTSLHYLGRENATQRPTNSLKYLLGQPGIERNLDTKDLSKIFFNSENKPSFAPVIKVILAHYLHQDIPEHNQENKKSIENYLVKTIFKYNKKCLLHTGQMHNYYIVTWVLFYYQKKFMHLDDLYKQFLGKRPLRCLHNFILNFKFTHLERLILEYEKYKLIQARFNLSNFNKDTNVMWLAQAIWHKWSLTTNEAWPKHPKNKMLALWTITHLHAQENGKPNLFPILPQELKDIILHDISEEIIAPVAKNLLIPHGPNQRKKAFFALLEGITFWHTRPVIFTQKVVNDKITLTRTLIKKENFKSVVQKEAHTIKAYLQEETTRQLKLFDPPRQ